MADNKTPATSASVDGYIASRANEAQRADCQALMAMLERVTGQGPKMWGPRIVGHGAYRYTLESGRAGEWCLAGVAIRGRELVVYLVAEGADQPALLARLGPHRMGKAFLYFRHLADLDASVLEQLVAGSVAELRRLRGAGGPIEELDGHPAGEPRAAGRPGPASRHAWPQWLLEAMQKTPAGV